jgi:hypothetical protein
MNSFPTFTAPAFTTEYLLKVFGDTICSIHVHPEDEQKDVLNHLRVDAKEKTTKLIQGLPLGLTKDQFKGQENTMCQLLMILFSVDGAYELLEASGLVHLNLQKVCAELNTLRCIQCPTTIYGGKPWAYGATFSASSLRGMNPDQLAKILAYLIKDKIKVLDILEKMRIDPATGYPFPVTAYDWGAGHDELCDHQMNVLVDKYKTDPLVKTALDPAFCLMTFEEGIEALVTLF